jgi:glycine/D-amino acid oxidase-like deaminating enzyme
VRETCLWWEDAPLSSETSAGAEPLPAAVDVAVVGGGYTGLSAARTLAAGGARVVVLEEGAIGSGASSRNGGQVLTGLKVGAGTLVGRFGEERAKAFFRSSLAAIDFLAALVSEEGIDCGFARCGHVEAAFKPSHFDALRREQELLDRVFGHAVRVVARRDQRSELGSDLYHGLLVDDASGALHPSRYVQGLAEAARRAGALLRPFAPVLSLARSARGFDLVTDGGSLSARDVLIATNGYTGGVAPALQRRVVPLGSYIVATPPLPEPIARTILPRGRVAFDTKAFLFYFRLTPERRLVFGGRAQFTPATPGSTRRAAAILRDGMVRVFPELRQVTLDFGWSGNVGITRGLLPRTGRIDGLHYALGYAGHGVAMATCLGHLVALRMLGASGVADPFWDLPLPAIPFYHGRPWFLPLVGLWYRVQDWWA